MIHVLAIITTKPGLRDSVLEIFRTNVPAVLAEAGCIEYDAAVDSDDAPALQSRCGPDTFVVIEKWASIDALVAHGGSAHMAAYGKKTRDMLASRIVHVLSPT